MASILINTWTEDNLFMDMVNRLQSKSSHDEKYKAFVGWGGIFIQDPDVDPVNLLDAFIKRTSAESCGQCTPCRLGTIRLSEIMDHICDGHGSEADLEQIRFLVRLISDTARCDIGRTMVKPVMDLLEYGKSRFDEVIQNKRQVRRCEFDGVLTAPCISACPSHVDIPSYLEDVRMDRWSEALTTVKKDCPMPGTIGRVCVRPCESRCKRNQLDSPLAIRGIKRFLADQEQYNGMTVGVSMPPRQSEKVAVVGAGPAGLSCAYYLGRQGYSCTIFESQEGPGGMAAYGIPSYRLPRDVIAHEVTNVEKYGAELRYGVNVGKDISVEEIAANGYQAVFIAVGAPESSKMRCEGEEAGYRCFLTGVDFLAKAARGEKPLDGKQLVVIGGGNVAMDCVRTARRLGFEDVNLLYRRTEAEMPADPQEIKEAKEEGVKFHYLIAPVEIMVKGDDITGLKCRRMELGEPDNSGRRRPVPVEGSDFIIDCDAIIPAVGQVCVVDCVLPDEDAVTKWKTLVVDDVTFQSEKKYVFGGGDCITGPATLIAALAAGKKAAQYIGRYLRQGKCTPKISDLLDALITPEMMKESSEDALYPGDTCRMEPEILDPESRVHHFEEIEKGFSACQARAEASRCLRCYRILLTAI